MKQCKGKGFLGTISSCLMADGLGAVVHGHDIPVINLVINDYNLS